MATIISSVLHLFQQGVTDASEIAERTGFSRSKVSRALRDLRKRDFAAPGRGRGIRADARVYPPFLVPEKILTWFQDQGSAYPELAAVLTFCSELPSASRMKSQLPAVPGTAFTAASISGLPGVTLVASKPDFDEPLRIERLRLPEGFPGPDAWFSQLVDVRSGELLEEKMAEVALSPVEEVKGLQQLLNAQEFDAAEFQERAKELGLQVDLSKANRHQVRSRLRSFSDFFLRPKQCYKAVERTLRLYTVGGGLQTMKSADREQLLAGCIQVDLKHFQAAVQAKLCGIESINEYVKEGFWERLAAESGAPKPVLKTAFYSLMYGATVYNTRKRALETGEMTLDQWEDFLDTKLITELFQRSEENLENLRAADSVLDAYDRNLRDMLAKRPKGKTSGLFTLTSARSMAGSQAQSYELKVLAPLVIHLLKKNVPVIAWLHDGFIIPPDHDPAVLEEALEIGRKLLKELEINSSFEITTLGKTE